MGRIGHCRQHILESGTKVLSSKGYNGTGVKEIVDAAGVPKGSFYNHFASKEAFVVEALDKLSKETLGEVESQLLDMSKTPQQRLKAFFAANFQYIKTCEYNGGCLFANLCLEMADEIESIRIVTDTYMQRVIKLIADCLVEAKGCSEVSQDCNTLELAAFIFYAWEGTVMQLKASKTEMPYTIFSNQLEIILNR